MADQYKVDLSELEETVRKLNKTLRTMERAKEKAKYQTDVPKGAFGSDFGEADKLWQAHDGMKHWIESLTDALSKLIERHGQNTSKAMGNYQDAEAEQTSTFSLG
ncbi:hypothetical protein GCM10010406_30340 [Streptomyces thermolineatus]|uniref:ESAT-6-like protein n=1 Tax=Streptomyces thermolineatus TaxID=44033 RepID=A0ABP5Z5T7_9ACTN